MYKLEITTGLKEHLEVIKNKWYFGQNKKFYDKVIKLNEMKFKTKEGIYNKLNNMGLSVDMFGCNGFKIIELKGGLK